MRSFLIILFFCSSPFVLFSQTDPTWGYINRTQADSLRMAIKTETKDTLNMAAFRKLGFYYQESIADSALFFHEEQLKLAKKLGMKIWEADAYSQAGYVLTLLGNPIKAYDYFMAAEQLAKDSKNENNNWRPWTFSNAKNGHDSRIAVLGMNYQMKGNVWNYLGDAAQQKNDYWEAARLGESIQNGKILFSAYASLSKLYPVDSSIRFLQKGLQAAMKDRFPVLGWGYLRLTDAYAQKGMIDSAIYYAENAKEASIASNDMRTLASYYNGIAGYYYRVGKKDSALFFAQKSFQTISTLSAGSLELADKYKALALAYAANGRPDSSAKYWQKTYFLNDSLRSKQIEYYSKYQKQAFDEQLVLKKAEEERTAKENRWKMAGLLAVVTTVLIIAIILYRNNRQKQKANKVLEDTLADLKSTQAQLVQSEKMASLGELTAGIAHEIQNPLNFVNNFSEVSNELVDEMNVEIDKGDLGEAKAIAADIKSNLEKINHHGKRADAIVKGMLQHSQSGKGQKALTDINALCDEYLRLSYHGVRAKDPSFNAKLKTDFDESIEKMNIVPQDIGRVMMNLLTNAFYAVSEKEKTTTYHRQPTTDNSYQPAVSVSTKKTRDTIEITVSDNGNGIPSNIIDKIFQPFFTTKPTGKGTGLGLSLTYDIIKAHGGEIKVEAMEGKGSTFTIILPA